jgi:hypothetical protein
LTWKRRSNRLSSSVHCGPVVFRKGSAVPERLDRSVSMPPVRAA